MNINAALSSAQAAFPFGDFARHPDRLVTIASAIGDLVAPKAKILDIGGGSGQVSAVLSKLGYDCTCFDDLNDSWHLEENHRQQILDFASEVGVRYIVSDGGEHPDLPFDDDEFDIVMLNDVLEHLHNSPRSMLNAALAKVRTGGYLFITVPNAVNARKRVAVLRGQTNHAPYSSYFWYPDPWRGHVREYTKGDLASMADLLGLEVVDLRSVHNMLSILPKPARTPFKVLTRAFPGLRDSWLLVAQKPAGWQPRTMEGGEAVQVFGRAN